MDSNIFRKTALDRLAAPEQLNQQVKVMRPATWIILLALVLVFVTAIVWMIIGNITTSTKLQGVIFPNSNVETVMATSVSLVQDVIVRPGDQVNVGDVIAVVRDDTALGEIVSMKEALTGMTPGTPEYKSLAQQTDDAVTRYVRSSVIKCSYAGYIQSVAARNTALNPGDQIATIMVVDPASSYNEVSLFVPKEMVSSLRLGMSAQISPSYAPRETYGYMLGVITYISSVPVSEETILNHMGTLEYVSGILPKSSSVEVRVRLNIDSASANHYQWSNPMGERVDINIGSICNVQIITRNYHPIELLLG